MRAIPLLATTLACIGAAACGLTVTGSGRGRSEEANSPLDAGPTLLLDGAVDPDASDSPATVTSFVCGSDTCTSGVQACCATGTTFACSAADAGCAVSDSGTPARPPMWCTSSAECNGQRLCCYSPTTGSTCSKSCGSDQVELCSLGFGGCGENGSCVRMNASPAPAVGQCDYSEDG